MALAKQITASKYFLPVIFVALLATVAAGSFFSSSAVETDAVRIQRLRESFACPECKGQSVAESNASVASNISRVIELEVAAGSSDTQIRNLLVNDWGEAVLLNPSSEGFSSLVWVFPIALIILAGLAFLILLFRKTANGSEGDSSLGGSKSLLGFSNSKKVAVGFFVVVIVLSVSFGLTQFVGERGVNDSLSGSIDRTPGQKLDECQTLTNSGEILEGIQCVDRLLAQDPDNSSLLANRGWFLALVARGSEQADTEQGSELYKASLENLDKALELKPSNTDALAWRAIVYNLQGDESASCDDLDLLLQNNPPNLTLELIDSLLAGC